MSPWRYSFSEYGRIEPELVPDVRVHGHETCAIDGMAVTLFLTKSRGWFVLLSFSRKYSLIDLVTTPVCSLPRPSIKALFVAIPHIVMA